MQSSARAVSSSDAAGSDPQRRDEEPRCVDFDRAAPPKPEPIVGDAPLGKRVPSQRRTDTSMCCYTPPDVVKGWIAPATAAAKRCYERALVLHPTLRGKLTVRFDLGASGLTTRSCEVDSLDTIEDAAFRRCVVRAFGDVLAPAADDCGVRTITYPMVFEPAG